MVSHHLSAGEIARKHEEFKSRLVDDVLGKETGRVPMEKVVMLVWQFRDDPAVVQFMAQFVAKYAGSRDVFDGIEFYLPQLAHMIIHLEVSWDDAILERFALIVAQQSLHFALQLNWILRGAIEDYQPENFDGTPNERYEPLFYSRCVKLLSNIERCVVYGTPRTHELQRLYEAGKISKKEYELMEQADRRFNAAQITNRATLSYDLQGNGLGPGGAPGAGSFGGDLLYKRKVRSAPYKRKRWKTRYFAVAERMLYCYNVHPARGGTLRRAMPLEGAEVAVQDPPDGAKYPHTFLVKNQLFLFVMRAGSDDERTRWADVLREESRANALYPHKVGQRGAGGGAASKGGDDEDKDDEDETSAGDSDRTVIRELTPSQRSRYDFFKDERDFVFDMCNVAEDLRFKDPTERKKLAPDLMSKLRIPRCCYVPMCNSTHTWQRVSAAVPGDTRVFNTKERCPVIMHYVTKRGETLHNHRGRVSDANLDVAEYLHLQYEVPDENKATKKPLMDGIEEVDEDEAEEEDDRRRQRAAGGAGVVCGFPLAASDVFFSCKEDMVAADNAGRVGLAGLGEEEELKRDDDDAGGIEATKSGDGNGEPEGEEGGMNDTNRSGAMLWTEDSKLNIGRRDSNEARPPRSVGGGGGGGGPPGSSPMPPRSPLEKGNVRVQRLIRENLVNLPQNLAKRMVSQRNLVVGSVVGVINRGDRDRDRDHHHNRGGGGDGGGDGAAAGGGGPGTGGGGGGAPPGPGPRKGGQKGHRHKSYLDRAAGEVDLVPIVEGRNSDNVGGIGGGGGTGTGGDDDQSVGSVGTGSVLTHEGTIVRAEEGGAGGPGSDGIDRESLERAKAVICRGESWADKSARMLREEEEARSKNGAAAGGGDGGEESGNAAICTEIVGVMAKSNDDLRQEVFVMQMIHFYKSVFAKARLPIWLKTYRILSTASDTGLIEVITDATSIDGLKKSEGFPEEGGMRAYFEDVYGPPDSPSFNAAQRNFMLSLVGYSLMSYLLGLKDRHNGNIMIDLRGHLVHIDFGFVMGMAPGHEFSLERAPFKITSDYVDVMGGVDSSCFAEFRRLFVAGFEAARSNSLVALGLVEIMMYRSNYPCFTGSRYGGGRALRRFERRLMLGRPDGDIPKLALGLIERSIGHRGTYLYDRFQLYSNGYAM